MIVLLYENVTIVKVVSILRFVNGLSFPGAVTPVKDQGICGSCWSFGSAETIEGALFLSRNRTGLTELSQQNLMDCTWAYGNAACDGGEETQAYEWIMKNGGIATAYSYGPYLMAVQEKDSKGFIL